MGPFGATEEQAAQELSPRAVSQVPLHAAQAQGQSQSPLAFHVAQEGFVSPFRIAGFGGFVLLAQKERLIKSDRQADEKPTGKVKPMYYVDCACSHDRFKEFGSIDDASTYFMNLPCEDKILYTETENGKFEVIMKTEIEGN